nr:DEAD/H-box helicase 11 [Halisarca dujardinii]
MCAMLVLNNSCKYTLVLMEVNFRLQGKSLSLICGALKWLGDHHRKQEETFSQLLSTQSSDRQSLSHPASNPVGSTSSDEPDWLTQHDQVKTRKDEVEKAKIYFERKEKRGKHMQEIRRVWRRHDNPTLKAKGLESEDTKKDTGEGASGEDEDILLSEYFSDEDGDKDKDDKSEDEVSDEDDQTCQIFYCSRTHSQLSQFVQEVRKSPYGNGTQVVSLASRQNMCINDQVRRLGSNQAINDRCLELRRQKNKGTASSSFGAPAKKRKTSKTSGCPYYKMEALEMFRDLTLSKVRDIEQLVSLGRELKACSYYGSRRAVPLAELVVVPYNTLLHSKTRKAVGIKLKGSVVIIDEAHNLLDTICNIHSVEISGAQVAKAYSQLTQYRDRYRDRLKAKNLLYISQILQVLKAFLTALKRPLPERCDTLEFKKLFKLNDFLFHLGIDHLNMFKILKYCEGSMISRKLNGFVDKYFDSVSIGTPTDEKTSVSRSGNPNQPAGVKTKGNTSVGLGQSNQVSGPPSGDVQQRSSPLMGIEAFLSALTNMDGNSRVSMTLTGQLSSSSLRFLLLNPSVHFEEIVRECRSIIVAGGTMQPVSEFKDQLFGSLGVCVERIREFSCGHVIPEDNLLALCLGRGPTGLQFDFTFRARDTHEQMSELGRTVANLCNVVPGGVVCFFPSYEYEQKVYSYWEHNGTINTITRKKQIFREPKRSSQLDTVLSQYARCIKSNAGSGSSGLTGGLLLSVVGGKMSEGINFSNELGRCVVMVGLPYPNLHSPELEEKMKYLDKTVAANSQGQSGGQVHYENLCMKAVNQSIGRAIRHSADYASVVLVDHRYSRPSIQDALPQWMRRSLVECSSFGVGYAAVRKFFKTKEKIQLPVN